MEDRKWQLSCQRWHFKQMQGTSSYPSKNIARLVQQQNSSLPNSGREGSTRIVLHLVCCFNFKSNFCSMFMVGYFSLKQHFIQGIELMAMRADSKSANIGSNPVSPANRSMYRQHARVIPCLYEITRTTHYLCDLRNRLYHRIVQEHAPHVRQFQWS